MYLEAIKNSLGINHSKIDIELDRLSKVACSELIRLGVPSNQITEDNVLVENAVIAYVSMHLYDDKTTMIYKESWECQADALRHHAWEE